MVPVIGIIDIDSTPPADADVNLAGGDAVGDDRDGLHARRAEAVDGHGRDFDRKAGAHRDQAGDVHALLGLGEGAAEDHVLDLCGGKLRPLQGLANGRDPHVIGPGVFEEPLTPRPNGVRTP